MGSIFAPAELDHYLAGHTLFSEAMDAEETCAKVANVFRPHDFSIAKKGLKLNAQMDSVSLQRSSISRLRYKAPISVNSEPMESFIMVMMPVEGKALVRCGEQETYSNSNISCIVNYSDPLSMNWDDQCDQLIIRVDRNLLDRTCEGFLGKPLREPLRFKNRMELTDPKLKCWTDVVRLLTSNASIFSTLHDFPLVARQYEQLLATTILNVQPHNYGDVLPSSCREITPSFMRKAEEFILQNVDQPITIEDLAKSLEVSVRTLYNGFQKYRDTTPMAYLAKVRLDRIHADLLEARSTGANASVTRIAMDWGVFHMGNFSKNYKARFGELPSETLGRR